MPSTVKPMFRLVPGAGPFFFLVGSPELAASEAGTGVELDSEAASAESVTLRVGTPLLVGMGVLAAGGEGAASEVCDDSSCFGDGLSSNLVNSSGRKRKMMGFDGFLDLSGLALLEIEGDRVGDMLDMVEVWVMVVELERRWRMERWVDREGGEVMG
jgi:hypothetical protein